MSYVLSPSWLAENVFTPVEREGGRVKNIWVHIEDFTHLRKLGRDTLDTDVNLMRSGSVASIWNAEVHVDRLLSPGIIRVEANNRMARFVCLTCGNAMHGHECTSDLCLLSSVHES